MRRSRRRRARRNPFIVGFNPKDSAATKIGWTIGIAALTAATGAIVIWWINRKLPQEKKEEPALSISGQWADAAKKAAEQARIDAEKALGIVRSSEPR